MEAWYTPPGTSYIENYAKAQQALIRTGRSQLLHSHRQDDPCDKLCVKITPLENDD